MDKLSEKPTCFSGGRFTTPEAIKDKVLKEMKGKYWNYNFYGSVSKAIDLTIRLMQEEQNKFEKIYASRKAEFESGIRVERDRIMTELPEKLDKVVDEVVWRYVQLGFTEIAKVVNQKTLETRDSPFIDELKQTLRKAVEK
jgi:hypothetical protein